MPVFERKERHVQRRQDRLILKKPSKVNREAGKGRKKDFSNALWASSHANVAYSIAKKRKQNFILVINKTLKKDLK